VRREENVNGRGTEELHVVDDDFLDKVRNFVNPPSAMLELVPRVDGGVSRGHCCAPCNTSGNKISTVILTNNNFYTNK